MAKEHMTQTPIHNAIAIVGMAGRFPEAHSVADFWHNVLEGKKSIRFFTEEEVLRAGADPNLVYHPDYVKAGSIIEDIDLFDASFFGFTPREAEAMDPQARLFLECAWWSLEDAGYDPHQYAGLIGIFAGKGFSNYMSNNLFTHPDLVAMLGKLQMAIGNERDSLAAMTAYKLNLRGPSISVQTFCSTSAVAIHLACQSLLMYECDMALAGGVAIDLPQGVGYLYQEGGILSPDGSCRTFDNRARGSVMGNGLGVVTLKRLENAIEDGDHIYAAILGSATNNDGISRVGFTAPGLSGQTAVILDALNNAQVPAETIGYIEAHGTATQLGDSIELAAMIKAFRKHTDETNFCAIGSVKPNVGHLDRASGVTGLIKTAMALKNQVLPPHLNFNQAHPDVNLDQSPFYVNTQKRVWPAADAPRRAGVSSFGLGGTNAHFVLQEVEQAPTSRPTQSHHLLVLSARTETALEMGTVNLADHLRENDTLDIADIAYTLQVGRRSFNHRRMVVCHDVADAIVALSEQSPTRVFTREDHYHERPVTFMFAGVGDHYINMGRDLYQQEPIFQQMVDHCCALAEPLLGYDLRDKMFDDTDVHDEKNRLRQMLGRHMEKQAVQETVVAQPIVFILEYSMAYLLQSWGLVPQAVTGYSLGEYVAACVAGVFSLEDALRLVIKRAQLIQTLPEGRMVAVAAAPHTVRPYLSDKVTLVAQMSTNAIVLGGVPEAVQAVEAQLAQAGLTARPLGTTHAFHTPMMEDILDPLRQVLEELDFNRPQIPIISNVTGTWIKEIDADYWLTHLCQTVVWHEGMTVLGQKQGAHALIEVGAGTALTSFAYQQQPGRVVVSTFPSQYDKVPDLAFLLRSVGELWLTGVTIDWAAMYGDVKPRRVSLPGYAFDRQRYWVTPDPRFAALWSNSSDPDLLAKLPAMSEIISDPVVSESAEVTPQRKENIADWFYKPSWEPAPLPSKLPNERFHSYLIFIDESGHGLAIAEKIREEGQIAYTVGVGDAFDSVGEQAYVLNPNRSDDYRALCRALEERGDFPQMILHMWSLSPKMTTVVRPDLFSSAQELGFYSLLFFAQALTHFNINESLEIVAVMNSVQYILADDHIQPEKAPLLAICKSIPQEYLTVSCRTVDLPLETEEFTTVLWSEAMAETADLDVAYRHNQRYRQTYHPIPLTEPNAPNIRQDGVYLITGGMGDIGLILATHLAQAYGAKLILVGRTALPARENWADWLQSHDETDRISRRIQKVLEIEALGADVWAVAADVADRDQMNAVLAGAIERFGALHGVIHAAGVSDDQAFNVIQAIEPEHCALHFQPKVYGTYVLADLLRDRELDFCILFSSLSSVLGGLGFVGYTAANFFMDVMTWQQNLIAATPWHTVNWDTWHTREGQHDILGGTLAMYEMEPKEGIIAFERVISQTDSYHLVNSTGDLYSRIRQWVRLDSIRGETVTGAISYASRPQLSTTFVEASSGYEKRIAQIWQDLLGIEQIGIYDNFFDLGGNSLIGLQIIARIKKEFDIQVPIVALFEAPTISTLAKYLRADQKQEKNLLEKQLIQRRKKARKKRGTQEIAIVAMASRFPQADHIDQFWSNLCQGVEAITRFSEEQLRAAGIPPEIYNQPNYVKARPILENAAAFDPVFFGYSPREAELTDPQQRLFLETAWHAMELAGYDPTTYSGLVGVFGGSNISSYVLDLISDPDFVRSLGAYEATYQMVIGNDRDSLATNTSYKLNLRGPSLSVQTFCSTSLVAVHLACQSLRNGECDMALAGGVSIRTPIESGYFYHEGGMESVDGHCRTFDANATGTLFGDGVGLVVLKRLDDALADGDYIHAVVKGSAMNNDGSLKVGYAAPSVEGQADVIALAFDDAGVTADTIGYIEAHGTATRIGDPIEVAALTRAFQRTTEQTQFCAIGSVKPNIGHLDRAAGISGLIKTAMVVERGVIPPLIHFETANPEIDFMNSPFRVNTQLKAWPKQDTPRRAGVSSLGMGGTNVHVVLEEPPLRSDSGPSRPFQLLTLSARTEDALAQMSQNLVDYLDDHPMASLADVAFTLNVGRARFDWRRTVVCQTIEDGISRLLQPDGVYDRAQERPFVFAFHDTVSCQTWDLYRTEPVFRAEIDEAHDYLFSQMGYQLRDALYPELGNKNDDQALQLVLPVIQQIALARLLISWGVEPKIVTGYGLGEWAAACIAGVFVVEELLALLVYGAVNGRDEATGELLLYTPDMPVVQTVIDGMNRRPSKMMLLVDGEWLPETQAGSSTFWGRRLQHKSDFTASITELAKDPLRAVLDMGAGLLSQLVTNKTAEMESEMVALHALPSADGNGDVEGHLTAVLGEIWQHGGQIEWAVYYGAEKRHREPLPTYPFARDRYWLNPRRRQFAGVGVLEADLANSDDPNDPIAGLDIANMTPEDLLDYEPDKIESLTDWFYTGSWQQKILLPQDNRSRTWWVFADKAGFIDALLPHLAGSIVTVHMGDAFAETSPNVFTVRPDQRPDYEQLLILLQQRGLLPDQIVHAWLVDSPDDVIEPEVVLQRGLFSVLALVQTLADKGGETCHIDLITSHMQDVLAADYLDPVKATMMGACHVIPQEFSQYTTRSIDVHWPLDGSWEKMAILCQQQLLAPPEQAVVALLHQHRWVQVFNPTPLPQVDPVVFRMEGVYLITGGLGGIGLGLAQLLHDKYRAKLALLSRSGLPPQSEWERVLREQGAESGVGYKISQVQALMDAGAEVLVLAADVSDEAAMGQAMAQIESRWGEINGVLHAAGVPASGIIALKEAEMAKAVLTPKLNGTFVLHKLLSQRSVDFLLLFSSMSAITGGGPGQIDYSAANAFCDAFARRHHQDCGRIISIGWGEWLWDAWQDGLQGFPPEAQAFFIAKREAFGISFADGFEAMERALAWNLPHVVVSTQDFIQMVDGSKNFSIAAILEKIQLYRQYMPKHSRPTLGVPYVPPRTPLEEGICLIWSDLLGIEEVGIHDNFFELGGNSLLGVDLIGKLRQEIEVGVELAVYTLYETPTVHDLAELLSRPPDTVAEEPDLDQIEMREAKRQEAIARQREIRSDT